MQITKDNLTIIIVTIKSQDVIDGCLKSIDSDIKKIIVENSNDKKFVNYLKEKYSNTTCYLTGKNLGMGTGNNFGIKKSLTRYVMILNPDTILKSDTLNKIFEISKNLDFAILSPISENKNFPNYKIFNNYKQNLSPLLEVDRVDGYSMILDKEQFKGDFFDENIFMYLENDDLCFRVKKDKKKIFIHSQSFINHLGAKTVNKKYFNELEFSRNWHWNWSKFYFNKKHHGFIKALFAGCFVFFKSIIKFLIYLMINNNFKKKIYYYRASGFINALLNKSSWFRPRLD